MMISSKAIDDFLWRYTHLTIADKTVSAPYWKDKLKKRIWGPFGGKGRPEQLIEATLKAAGEKEVDLGKLTSAKIRIFMKRNRIGVDCSGLAYWLLDAQDRERGGNGLVDDIPGAQGRFLVRANVSMLTSESVSVPIKKIADLRIGDMIRLSGGRHLVVVTQIKKEEGVVKEITYAHSSPETAVDGVHTAKILVSEENLGLEEQNWQETTKKGENYGQEFFHPGRGDGIRRFRFWL